MGTEDKGHEEKTPWGCQKWRNKERQRLRGQRLSQKWKERFSEELEKKVGGNKANDRKLYNLMKKVPTAKET